MSVKEIISQLTLNGDGWNTALWRDRLATVRATGVPAALIAVLNIVEIKMIGVDQGQLMRESRWMTDINQSIDSNSPVKRVYLCRVMSDRSRKVGVDIKYVDYVIKFL